MLKTRPRPPKQTRRRRKANGPALETPDLASLIRGMYQRVARRLKLDPSYISRVARSERRSKSVERALRLEIRRILKLIGKRKRTGRKRGKKA